MTQKRNGYVPGRERMSTRAQRGGYALPEVLVATVVLAMIASAFYAALSSGFLITQAAREDLRATQIMMQKMEGLRLCTWSQISSYTFQEQYDPMSGTNRGTVYTGTVTSNAVAGDYSGVSYRTNLCLVTLTLRWTNSNSRIAMAHERKMQTLVGRYGMQSYLWGAIR